MSKQENHVIEAQNSGLDFCLELPPQEAVGVTQVYIHMSTLNQ